MDEQEVLNQIEELQKQRTSLKKARCGFSI